MQTQHTPGPWHVFEPLESGSQHSIGYWIPGRDERYWLASVYPVREVPHKFCGPHCDTAEANARLIAAAPAMYEALERIANHEYRTDRRHRGMIDISEIQTLERIARAALTKVQRELRE